jgi:hypothetical protein
MTFEQGCLNGVGLHLFRISRPIVVSSLTGSEIFHPFLPSGAKLIFAEET